ncbi:MAG: PAS domain-containing protein [Actinobacteria bacterium]|nr:PAS domain-containing protein [Actinomycetota bacterium]
MTDDATPFSTTAGWKTSALYVVWAIDGTVLSASDSYAQLVGKTVDEIIGLRWPELVPDEASFCWQQLHFSVEALRTAPVLVVDMPTQAGGSTAWLRWTEWAIRDARGELVQVRSTAVDISELHETRAALAATIDSVAAARAAGRQEVAERLHNGAVQQLTAARWAISDGDFAGALALVDSALSAVRSSVDALDPPQVGVSLVSGVDIPASWVGQPVASGHDDVAHWLTDAATSLLADAVLVFSSAGVVWASAAARAMFGDLTAPFDLATMVSYVHPDDRTGLAQGLTAGLAGEQHRLHWRFRHPTQGWRHLVTRFVPLAVPDRRPLAVAVTVDIEDGLHAVLDRAKDAERDRIAADLHDDALQQLAGLRWMLTAQGADDAVFTELTNLEESIRGQVTRLLSAVHDRGLEVALDRLAACAATPTTIVADGDLSTVPLDVADRAWRSVRELLRNVDQHASATRAVVELSVADSTVSVAVSDDGIGFAPEMWASARQSGHVGLASLRETVLVAGGSFVVATGPDGNGTRVSIELPLE